MDLNRLLKSRFLKQSDVPQPKVVTITKIELENVARPGEKEEVKGVISFAELPKPMVLNATNTKCLGRILRTDDTDEMIGKKVEVYKEEHVEYAGAVTGGLRLRAATLPSRNSKPNPEEEPTWPEEEREYES